MEKSSIHMYVNNIIAFIIFSCLKLIFRERTNLNSKSLLFMNSGQIGDLIVSSILLENEKFFKDYNDCTFLVKNEYLELFKNYRGKFEIIGYDSWKYKYSVSYKIKFIKFLREKKFNKCFNLTAARGIINDELAILIGASEVYCLNSNWKYLKKIFGKKMEAYYTEVLTKTVFNEYDKHLEVLRIFDSSSEINFNENQLFGESEIQQINGEQHEIVIAPFSSVENRDWPLENYKKLITLLPENINISLLGNKKQRAKLDLIADQRPNVRAFPGILELNEIPQIIKNSRLFIGIDSGLSHIALKLDIPLIIILGGGQFGRFLPFNYKSNKKKYFLAQPLDCYGCEWRCILNEKECITKISVEQVFELTLSILNN